MRRGPLSGEYRAALDAIVAARRSAGLTQRAVADILIKPPSYVAKIELGERKLDFLEFIELADAIGCSPMTLLERVQAAVRNQAAA